jgi:hypothetical protein
MGIRLFRSDSCPLASSSVQLRAAKIPAEEFTTLPNGLKYAIALILLHICVIFEELGSISSV